MKKMTYQSPLGQIIMLATDKYLYGLWFAGQKYCGGQFNLDLFETGLTKQTKKAISWLNQYFAGQVPQQTGLSIRLVGTPFQKKVYRALLKIPFGHTTSYKDLADQLHSSPCAIGNATAHNQILLIIPCHRVLGTDGSLTGYAGGLKRKRALLKLESSLHS